MKGGEGGVVFGLFDRAGFIAVGAAGLDPQGRVGVAAHRVGAWMKLTRWPARRGSRLVEHA